MSWVFSNPPSFSNSLKTRDWEDHIIIIWVMDFSPLSHLAVHLAVHLACLVAMLV